MRSYLPVQLKPLWFLVAIEGVREVLGHVKMARIPQGDPHVPAIVTWRARVLPVIDLAVGVSGLTPLSGEEGRERTMVLSTFGGSFAAPIDAVREVIRLDERVFVPRHVAPDGLVEVEVDVNGTIMGLFDPEAFRERLISSLGGEHAG